jgi:hypothetical protein
MTDIMRTVWCSGRDYRHLDPVAYPGIFGEGGGAKSLTNSVEDRGQRERESVGVSPLVRGRGFTSFANE